MKLKTDDGGRERHWFTWSKVAIASPGNDPKAPRRHTAMTLIEVTVSMAVFMLTLAGVIYAHLTGLKLNEIVKAKLGASDEARRAISKLVNEVRTSDYIRIGTGSVNSFTEAPPNTPQQGNALEIYPNRTNTSIFTRYFWDTERLKRTENGSATAVLVVANSINNQIVFTSENFDGTILTDKDDNRVIGLTLDFYALEYPSLPIGQGNYYDSYLLRTKMAKRAL
jgi:type II secretory pathway pseudopilin PulG